MPSWRSRPQTPTPPPSVPPLVPASPLPAAFTGARGIPLGWYDGPDGTVHPVTYTQDQHLVTIGPTGSGKNTMAQTPALLDPRNTASALVIDVKGQLCAITTRQRQALGQRVVVLNPYGVLGLPSVTYNPLAALDPTALSFVSDCERLAEGLVDVRKGDHWELSALDYVTLLILWVRRYTEAPSLSGVYTMLSLADTARQAFCKELMACDDPTIALSAARYTSDSNEVRDCIETARVQLAFLRDPAIQRVLDDGPTPLRFADLKRQPMTVFVIIPPELLHTRAKFLRLIVMSALGELIRERTRPPEPVLFMLDEFAQLGAMSLIENAAAIVRDYQLRLWIILQNLPQLKALYGERWESFLSSAGVVQVFTPNDMTTAEYFSKRAGLAIDWQLSQNSSYQKSYTEHRLPRYTEQDLFGTADTQQFLFGYRLAHPLLTQRYPYYALDAAGGAHQRYAGTYDPDPYHMSTEEQRTFIARAQHGAWHIPLPGVGARGARTCATPSRPRVATGWQAGTNRRAARRDGR